jgi:hypothetical protein
MVNSTPKLQEGAESLEKQVKIIGKIAAGQPQQQPMWTLLDQKLNPLCGKSAGD